MTKTSPETGLKTKADFKFYKTGNEQLVWRITLPGVRKKSETIDEVMNC